MNRDLSVLEAFKDDLHESLIDQATNLPQGYTADAEAACGSGMGCRGAVAAEAPVYAHGLASAA